MRLSLTTPSVSDAHAVQTLHGWLLRDPGLAAEADISQRSSAGGHMGALDVIDLVLTHAVAVGGLVLAFASWRRTRPDAPPIVFTVEGITVTAADASPETLERIRATLLAALPPAPSPGPAPAPSPSPGPAPSPGPPAPPVPSPPPAQDDDAAA
ncbi:hypothetical protein AB0J72_44250 [Dactylosporangium sp. NPDC049742]|uniref:effector-associated constant component EACC1 n=1 Tax=Dactylosporangium sp. NPDC049742 TaxID=3154737 RepID=UPI003411FD32